MAERNARRAEITRDFDSMERVFYWVRCGDLTSEPSELICTAFRTLEDAREFAESWQDSQENPEISSTNIG